MSVAMCDDTRAAYSEEVLMMTAARRKGRPYFPHRLHPQTPCNCRSNVLP